MTQEIIRMARDAGFYSHHNPDLYDCMVSSYEAIERLVALARADEREACAKMCEENMFFATGEHHAQALRARRKTHEQ